MVHRGSHTSSGKEAADIRPEQTFRTLRIVHLERERRLRAQGCNFETVDRRDFTRSNTTQHNSDGEVSSPDFAQASAKLESWNLKGLTVLWSGVALAAGPGRPALTPKRPFLLVTDHNYSVTIFTPNRERHLPGTEKHLPGR